jgi:hypothetical protein
MSLSVLEWRVLAGLVWDLGLVYEPVLQLAVPELVDRASLAPDTTPVRVVEEGHQVPGEVSAYGQVDSGQPEPPPGPRRGSGYPGADPEGESEGKPRGKAAHVNGSCGCQQSVHLYSGKHRRHRMNL